MPLKRDVSCSKGILFLGKQHIAALPKFALEEPTAVVQRKSEKEFNVVFFQSGFTSKPSCFEGHVEIRDGLPRQHNRKSKPQSEP